MNKCTGEMEVFSRVVGYYRPVSSWNKGKKHEFFMRKTFKMPELEDVETDDDRSLLSVAD
jgi:ribonucleoside-triphosphate reductase